MREITILYFYNLQIKDAIYIADQVTEEEEHGLRLKFDYELVVNENAYESRDYNNYYSYLGIAFGESQDEVSSIVI